MTRRFLFGLAAVLAVVACNDQQEPNTNSNSGPEFASTSGTKPINVVLNQKPTAAHLAALAKLGTVHKQIPEINAVIMSGKETSLAAILALPFVKAANYDALRAAPPFDAVALPDFTAAGISVWNQDAVNVTNPNPGANNDRVQPLTGDGVYVAILDTGLLPTWRQYLPQERIVEEYAKSFGGGGNDRGNVSEQPNKWERDVHSHGTHVTSIVLGYSLLGTPVNGTAPKALVIPVKVLGQTGSGWSSVIAEGVTYIGTLKAPGGPLADEPVVINMSLGGPVLDAIESEAIDFAIRQGVIIVASAGNNGPTGAMGFPGGYGPVISVAALGHVAEWAPPFGNAWWNNLNTADPTVATDYYVADFSALRTGTQDLDVAAPGSWVVGPYQTSLGQLSYFFVGGTSQSAPHVTGIVALMLQKNATLGVAPGVRAATAENILQTAAIQIPDVNQQVRPATGAAPETPPSWDENRSGSGLVTADAALSLTP